VLQGRDSLRNERGYASFTFEREANQKMEVPLVRVKITLSCTECKQRNYNTMKEKKNNPDRLEMKKYCRFCKKHTLHKETK
jgi:large subunit ribosomal protein L33